MPNTHMLSLIDSHCHIDDARFDADRQAMLTRARAIGIEALIIPATNAAKWPRLQAIADPEEGLYPAYGLHPMYLNEHRPEHLNELAEWLARERPVAVGECGLDFYVKNLDQTRQTTYLVAQLRLARDFNLPVILHARHALDDVMKHLRRFPGLRGVVHSFSGSLQQAEQLFAMGFCIGLGGPLTFPRAQRLRKIATLLPLEALLLESDSPDQPDANHYGQRNEPAYLIEVLETLAELRDTDSTTIGLATASNARALFSLAPDTDQMEPQHDRNPE